ncbi:RimJ/RimL family protein N-acetyltransferase [Bradyrhizobium sp. USDA 4461]
MFALRAPHASLARIDGPRIETHRLILRPWREDDAAPYTAMLSDPSTSRYITADGKPVVDPMTGWRHAMMMAGHWAVYGVGMFAVEEKTSGLFVGRVGPWFPPVWPGFEVGWAIAKQFRGNGYAVEAARASISWAFMNFTMSEIIHCIDRENRASQATATRLGARMGREIELFGHPANVWVTDREALLQRLDPVT